MVAEIDALIQNVRRVLKGILNCVNHTVEEIDALIQTARRAR
jgi:hypothetical protein